MTDYIVFLRFVFNLNKNENQYKYKSYFKSYIIDANFPKFQQLYRLLYIREIITYFQKGSKSSNLRVPPN